nr:MAG TPA: helix-turn-helix domain protein [Caudoviricetes sp.]
MTVWGLQDQLAEIIDMLLNCYPMGLRVLTGEASPPAQEDIHLMYQAARVGEDPGIPMGNPGTPPPHHMDQVLVDEQNFNKVIERSGGWKHITSTVREWSEYRPKTWAVIEAHVTWVSKGGFSRLDEPQLEQIAERHGLAPETVQRYRREFPDYIAIAVLRSRPKFELAGPDGKYPAA